MSRAVLAPFEAYQKARVTFVQTVAELAQRPQNIEALQSAGKYLFLRSSLCQITCLLTFFRCYGSFETTPS
jgi:hypothetical protein